ncbi:MAG: hypothetical protein V4649_14430 [Bacteroidota bacterium]
MFEIILLTYLSFRNSVRAKKKGLNGLAWGGVTAITFVAGMIIGIIVVVWGFCSDKVNTSLMASPDPKVRNEITRQLMELFNQQPLHLFTIELFAIGGYLLVRYVLDKRPSKNGEIAEEVIVED